MSRTSSDAAVIVGERIAAVRKSRSISQRNLGDFAGIDVSNISKYERGLALPNLGSVIRIAEALSIDPGELIMGITSGQLPESREVLTAREWVVARRQASAG
ncbi:MAG: helix-turn-helix domain-containing protein [Rhodoglobus sp.]